MFSLLHGFYEQATYVRERPIVVLGIASAGKSSILEWLKAFFSLTNPTSARPQSLDKITTTVGLNVAKLRTSTERLLLWDLGGAAPLRPIWDRYAADADALIWVVDSTDRDSFEESRLCLKELTTLVNLQSSPLLVLANKQDSPDAADPVKVSLALDLLADAEVRPQCVQPCSASTGSGIRQGMEWLLQALQGESRPGMRIP